MQRSVQKSQTFIKVYLLNHTHVVPSDVAYSREQDAVLPCSKVNGQHRSTHQLSGCSVLVPTQWGVVESPEKCALSFSLSIRKCMRHQTRSFQGHTLPVLRSSVPQMRGDHTKRH